MIYGNFLCFFHARVQFFDWLETLYGHVSFISFALDCCRDLRGSSHHGEFKAFGAFVCFGYCLGQCVLIIIIMHADFKSEIEFRTQYKIWYAFYRKIYEKGRNEKSLLVNLRSAIAVCSIFRSHLVVSSSYPASMLFVLVSWSRLGPFLPFPSLAIFVSWSSSATIGPARRFSHQPLDWLMLHVYRALKSN